jgi:predicted nucleotide-binding protein (sugar kinase/HSP70/actin superfamily)
MAGLCRSIIENVFTKVIRMSNLNGLGDKIVVQGGTFKNDAVLRSLEQYLGKQVVRAPYPGEMGAIGIALLTKRHIAENGFTSPHGPGGRTRFIGLDSLEALEYTQESNLKCTLCANNCSRTLISFSNGNTWITGNRCERGEVIGNADDAAFRERVRQITAEMESVPDMIKIREKLFFRDYPFTPVIPKRDCTIGLPRVLDFWRTMPFFTTFFHALGFKTKISHPSSRKLFEEGLPFVASDTVCFPAKLVHGHFQDLIASKVDRVFLPIFSNLPSENPEPTSTYTCPVLKGYPLAVKYADNPEHHGNTPMDTPIFHWFKQRDRDYQICRYMRETFGISEDHTRQAIAQGDAALADFNAELVAEGAKIIAQVEKEGKFAVVVTGRHYQFDTLVNHNLSRYFTNWGIPVLTVDALPDLDKIDLSKTMVTINNSNHARLLSGGIAAARHPALEYVQIFSFGCGHDAIYTDEVTRLMHDISGKSPLVLKLDESDVEGPLRIRVRSFIETVQARRRQNGGEFIIKKLEDPYPAKFTKADKHRTILVPNINESFAKILTAAIRQYGFKAEPLPLGGREAMQLGKKYVHNDTCFPAQMVIGEALEALKSGRYNPDEVIIGTANNTCDCRLTNYMVLTRKALDDAGFPSVPILSTEFTDIKNLHPGFRFNTLSYARISWCLIMMDILDELRHKIRPYELLQGETNRVFNLSIDGICDGLWHKGMLGAFDAYKKAIDAMCAIEYDRSEPRHRIFITGENVLTFHPGTNFYIEEYLEKNNMETKLPRMYDIYQNLMLYHTVSEIKDFHVRHSLPDSLYAILGEQYFAVAIGIMEKVALKHPLFEPGARLQEMAALTDDIIHHSIQSGEGFLMAADILHCASRGVKSFVILQPFGCLPNHVCGRGIMKRIKEIHPDIQILPLDYDPDTSFANIENRLQMLIMNARMSEMASA